jgi:hypothetical protein
MVCIAPKLIAEVLTAIDHEMFSLIPIREFLCKTFLDPAQSPFYSEMVTRFNMVCLKSFSSRRSVVILSALLIVFGSGGGGSLHSC